MAIEVYVAEIIEERIRNIANTVYLRELRFRYNTSEDDKIRETTRLFTPNEYASVKEEGFYQVQDSKYIENDSWNVKTNITHKEDQNG